MTATPSWHIGDPAWHVEEGICYDKLMVPEGALMCLVVFFFFSDGKPDDSMASTVDGGCLASKARVWKERGTQKDTSGQTVGEKLLFKDRVTGIHSVLGDQTAIKAVSPSPSQLSLLL